MKKEIKKCDVLLTYEIRNREIENLCLIKWELERRGYTVCIRSQYSSFFWEDEPLDARVVVVPGFYRERALFYSASHTLKTSKIVNMVSEQVFSVEDEKKEDTLVSIKPWGYKAAHVAWGYYMKNRMTNDWNVPENHVFLTGQVGLDFLNPKLCNYYMNRSDLYAKYSIPRNARTHLFVSSMSYADMDAVVLKNATDDGDTSYIYEFAKIAKKTREILIGWFEKVLEDNPDDVIIYRPHPEENRNSEILKELENKQPRFKVISEESIKQWFLAVDRIYVWYTTAIAEAFAAKKKVSVLRPIPLPDGMDIRIYQNLKFVNEYEEFKARFADAGKDETISDEIVSQYWYIDAERLAYEKVCDVIEKVMHEDEYNYEPPLENAFLKRGLNKERAGVIVKRIIVSSKLLRLIHNSRFLSGTRFRELLDNVFYVEQKLKKNFVSDGEIDEIVSKIDVAIAVED